MQKHTNNNQKQTIYPNIHALVYDPKAYAFILMISHQNKKKQRVYTFQNESRWKSYFHELLIYNTEDLYQFSSFCCFQNNRHTPPTNTVRRNSRKMFCICFCLFFFFVCCFVSFMWHFYVHHREDRYKAFLAMLGTCFLYVSLCVCVCSNNIFISSCLFSRAFVDVHHQHGNV